MRKDDLKFLLSRELPEVNPNALYVLVKTRSGLLLEDFAPLLDSLEVVYRRLLTLSVDSDVRKLLEKRSSQEATLSGVSKSINTKYRSLLVPKEEEYKVTGAEKRRLRYETERSKLPTEESDHPSRPYVPHRIEIARCQVTSPGFIELLGDPQTVALLVSLLGWLLSERRNEREHQENKVLSLRQSERENVSLLMKMDFSVEEIRAVKDYLKEDISVVLEILEESKCLLAPGDNVDPSNSNELSNRDHGNKLPDPSNSDDA